jgi:tetratricopeptide (TPR) repeat protein
MRPIVKAAAVTQLFTTGRDLSAKQQYPKAIEAFTRAIELEPGYIDAYVCRGIAYIESGDATRALADLTTAVQDATQAIALGAGKSGYNNRAIALEKKGDYPAAVEDWNKVLELEPGNAVALCLRGKAYEKIGEKGKAISDLRQGLKDSGKLGSKIKKESEELLQKLVAGQ